MKGVRLEDFRDELNRAMEAEDKARTIRNSIAGSGSPHVNADDVEQLADATVVGIYQLRRIIERLLTEF